MKTTVTNKELALFAANAQMYAMNHPGTKFSKTLDKVKKANQSQLDAYYEAIEEINIDLASTDDKQNLVYENLEKGIYAYSKENKKKLIQAIRELNNKPVEVTYKYTNSEDYPIGLGDDFKAVFTPFVIAPVLDLELEPHDAELYVSSKEE